MYIYICDFVQYIYICIICVYTYIYIYIYYIYIYTRCRKVWFAKSLYTVVGFDCSLSFWGLLEYVNRYNQQIPRIWKWVCLKTIDPERSSEVFLKFKKGEAQSGRSVGKCGIPWLKKNIMMQFTWGYHGYNKEDYIYIYIIYLSIYISIFISYIYIICLYHISIYLY